EARSRFAMRKAAKLAERAVALATTPLERATALEHIGLVALNDYRGDLAWSSLGESADLLRVHAPQERSAIARVCARAVEAPLRWPGSMRTIPPEADVRRYLELGFDNVEAVDGEELVRLLLARAFEPYAFAPSRDISEEEFEQAAHDGDRAADMAMRLGRPDLAS